MTARFHSTDRDIIMDRLHSDPAYPAAIAIRDKIRPFSIHTFGAEDEDDGLMPAQRILMRELETLLESAQKGATEEYELRQKIANKEAQIKRTLEELAAVVEMWERQPSDPADVSKAA